MRRRQPEQEPSVKDILGSDPKNTATRRTRALLRETWAPLAVCGLKRPPYN